MEKSLSSSAMLLQRSRLVTVCQEGHIMAELWLRLSTLNIFSTRGSSISDLVDY